VRHLPAGSPGREGDPVWRAAPTCSDAERWPRPESLPRLRGGALDPVLSCPLNLAVAGCDGRQRPAGSYNANRCSAARWEPPCREAVHPGGLAGSGPAGHFAFMASTAANLARSGSSALRPERRRRLADAGDLERLRASEKPPGTRTALGPTSLVYSLMLGGTGFQPDTAVPCTSRPSSGGLSVSVQLRTNLVRDSSGRTCASAIWHDSPPCPGSRSASGFLLGVVACGLLRGVFL